jgi:hypothetical protein
MGGGIQPGASPLFPCPSPGSGTGRTPVGAFCGAPRRARNLAMYSALFPEMMTVSRSGTSGCSPAA